MSRNTALIVATYCCFDARLETCDVNCSGSREEANIENYSLDPPQSRSSSAPSNFHSSFFSTFIQSQPNYVVPAVQNVHFLFLNVCGLKINYVNMNLFREKILILTANQRQWLACFYKAVFSGGGLALCLQRWEFSFETFETGISVLRLVSW